MESEHEKVARKKKEKKEKQEENLVIAGRVSIKVAVDFQGEKRRSKRSVAR